jgi:hypothetical protein
MKKIIKEIIVKTYGVDNMDQYVLEQLFGPDYEDVDYQYELANTSDKGWNFWGIEHMPIQMLQDILDELKREGATHIQIEPDTEHDGYHISGVRLEVLPDQDVKKIERENLESAIKNREIALKLSKQDLQNSKEDIVKLKIKLGELKEEETNENIIS